MSQDQNFIRRGIGGGIAALLACSSLSPDSANSATLVPNYLDGASEGFNDATFGADRKSAFEYALGLWSAVLGDGYAGETITVDAMFDPLGGTGTSATLGFAGANSGGFAPGNPLGSSVFFLAGLRNHLSGSDVTGITASNPTGNEISATFNSDVDGTVVLGSNMWYYGTDEMSGTDFDFVETALHEIGHGLGWSGTLDLRDTLPNPTPPPPDITNPNFGNYLNGSVWNSYDHFVVRTSDGAALTSLSTADRLTAVAADDISWDGALGIAANGGTAPDLYAPGTIASGSTYSHLDEGDFPSELMSPDASPPSGHAFSPLTLAVLEDQLWTIVPEPSSAVLLIGTAGLALLRRRRPLKGA